MNEETTPKSPTASDTSLARSYVAGDASTFREVDAWIRRQLEARYPTLRTEIDDVSQSVHVKLLENLHGGQFGGRSSLRTYVSAITHYTAIDRIRRDRAQRQAASDFAPEIRIAASDPYRSLVNSQEGSRLHAALHQLDAACLEMWRMVFLERLSYAAIGTKLSIAAGTVKSRMWYCRQKFTAIVDSLRSSAFRKART